MGSPATSAPAWPGSGSRRRSCRASATTATATTSGRSWRTRASRSQVSSPARARRTQVAFFEAWPPETFPVTFYRLAPAPDTLLTLDDVPTATLARAPLVIVSAALLAVEPARATALRILEMRAASRADRPESWTLLDLDWRPTLWADPGEAPDLASRAAGLADVLIGSDAEFAAAHLDPRAALDLGPRLIAVKHGPDGASAITRAGRRTVPGIPVDVVCGLGSGDALTAAFAAGLLRGPRPGGGPRAGQRRGGYRRLAADVQHVHADPGRDRRPAGPPTDAIQGGAPMTAHGEPTDIVIHAAKLPSRLPPELLHIRPGADGVVATDPVRAGWRYLSFRAFGLEDGETMLLDRPEEEAAIVTISGGGVELSFDGASTAASGPAVRVRGHALERLRPGRVAPRRSPAGPCPGCGRSSPSRRPP